MFNKDMYQLGNEPSAIRTLFAYGLMRKDQIGADKVFDFSIGNPSIPAPAEVGQALRDIISKAPEKVHAYTPAQGAQSTREAIAASLNRRFNAQACADDLYITVGAAASLSISLRALTIPSEEILVVSPYFPEYKVWIENARCVCVEVASRSDDFRLDFSALEIAITKKTAGIIINSPNNPVGVVYSEEDLITLTALLKKKEDEFARAITLFCDEPYRELVYDGINVPFVPHLYDRTIVCYSYSKSLSLPGERIGYLFVPPTMPDASSVYKAICGSGRALGYVCAPALFQAVIERCVDVPTDIEAYVKNRKLLTEGLKACGYEFIEPQGAFYLWVKALEPQADVFVERAKNHELLIVPSTSFGCDGWVRIGYCVSEDTIRNSLPAFEALKKEYSV